MPLSLAVEVGLLAVIEELQAVTKQLLIKVDGINSVVPGAAWLLSHHCPGAPSLKF